MDKYLDFAKELEKSMKHEGDGDNNCNRCPWNGLKRSEKETRGTEDQRKNRDYPEHCTAKISLNNQQNPGDLKRLAVIQTSVKNYLFEPIEKTCKG